MEGSRNCGCKEEVKELKKKIDKVVVMVEDIVRWVREEREGGEERQVDKKV